LTQRRRSREALAGIVSLAGYGTGRGCGLGLMQVSHLRWTVSHNSQMVTHEVRGAYRDRPTYEFKNHPEFITNPLQDQFYCSSSLNIYTGCNPPQFIPRSPKIRTEGSSSTPILAINLFFFLEGKKNKIKFHTRFGHK
jgi:hypothetical protein